MRTRQTLAQTNPLIEALPDTWHMGLRVKSFEKPCVDFHWHFHPEIELICVEKGQGVRYVGRSMEPFSSGDLCLIGANVPHAFGSLPVQRKGARWSVGHFLEEKWGEDFWKLSEMRRVAKLLLKSRQGLYFDRAETGEIRVLFAQLEGITSRAMRLARWLEILDRLANCRKTRVLNPASIVAAESDSRLQKALAMIEANIDAPDMTQARIARDMGMSPQAFCRFFRVRMGRPFHRYINEARVARACGELLDHERPIAEIAFATGFNNLANFNRRFLEIMGATPREYRRDALSH